MISKGMISEKNVTGYCINFTSAIYVNNLYEIYIA